MRKRFFEIKYELLRNGNYQKLIWSKMGVVTCINKEKNKIKTLIYQSVLKFFTNCLFMGIIYKNIIIGYE